MNNKWLKLQKFLIMIDNNKKEQFINQIMK